MLSGVCFFGNWVVFCIYVEFNCTEYVVFCCYFLLLFWFLLRFDFRLFCFFLCDFVYLIFFFSLSVGC